MKQLSYYNLLKERPINYSLDKQRGPLKNILIGLKFLLNIFNLNIYFGHHLEANGVIFIIMGLFLYLFITMTLVVQVRATMTSQ